MPVRVAEEAVVDVVFGVFGWWVVEGDAFFFQAGVGVVDILRDQREDDAAGLDSHSVVGLADADETIGADLIDFAAALIKDQRQAESVLVEFRTRVEIADGEEGDLLVEHQSSSGSSADE